MNFFQLNTISTKRTELLDYIENADGWFVSNGFNILRIPDRVLDIKILKLKLKFDGTPIVFKMMPNTFYRFHTDENRQCAINLLLTGFESNCYFGEQTSNEEVIENVTELKYDQDKYYLLNTRKKHAVRNGKDIRYIISIGFNSYDFETVNSYCRDNNL
jgi:hypothetical protein